MLTIYHLERSRSGRVIWLAEELGLDYAVERFARTPEQLAPAEYKALHPLGRSPIIRDGDLVLAETGAVFDYILARHGAGRLVPDAASPAYAQHLFWMHFAEGTLMAHHLALYMLDLVGARAHAMWPALLDSLAKDVGYAEATLAERPYLAGETFTACDIVMALALQAPRQFQDSLPAFPHVEAYLARLAERPAYQRAQPSR